MHTAQCTKIGNKISVEVNEVFARLTKNELFPQNKLQKNVDYQYHFPRFCGAFFGTLCIEILIYGPRLRRVC